MFHNKSPKLSDCVFALILASVFVSAAQAQVTVQFKDGFWPDAGYVGTRDTTLTNGTHLLWNPALNYDGKQLQAQGKPLSEVSLLRFDVSSIPTSAVVNSAALTLFAINGAYTVKVYKSLRNWDSSQATWAEYATGLSWGTPGSQGAGTDKGTSTVAAVDILSGTYVLAADSGTNPSLLTAIQSWVSTPSSNQGLVIQELATNTDLLQISGTADATLSRRPKLQITYNGSSNATFQNGVSPTAGYAGTSGTTIGSGPDPATVSWNDQGLFFSGDSWSPPDRKTLLKFDLSSVPSWGSVVGAGMTLHTASLANAINAYPSRKNWTETGATWDTYDGVNAWDGTGSSGAQDRSATSVASFLTVVSNAASSNFSDAGVSEVQGWVDGTLPNNGLLLMTDPSISGQMYCSDREDPGPNNRPEFFVTYFNGQLKPGPGQRSAGVGAASPPLFIERSRLDGTPIGAGVPEVTAVLTASSSSVEFSTDGTTWSPAPYSLTIPLDAGQSVPFFFRDSPAKTFTLFVNSADAGDNWVGGSALETVSLNPLFVSPTDVTVHSGDVVDLEVDGGMPPYFMSLNSLSGGTLSGSRYTAGNTTEVVDVITVADSQGSQLETHVQVILLPPSNLAVGCGCDGVHFENPIPFLALASVAGAWCRHRRRRAGPQA